MAYDASIVCIDIPMGDYSERRLSKILDHEARNRQEKANKQGREFVEIETLSERQRDQLREGAEKLRKAAKRREANHKKSLVANLNPVSLSQASTQLRNLKEILALLPPSDLHRKAIMMKEVERLERALGPTRVKKRK